MKDVVIWGRGALGRLAVEIAADINDDGGSLNILGFLDSNPDLRGTEVAGQPVLGGLDWIANRSATAIVVAVNSPSARMRIVRQLHRAGHTEWASLVHPNALIGRRTTIGEGTIVYPGSVIDVDVKIGCHVVINKLASIGHDSLVNDFCTIAPGVNLGGHVTLGEGCDIGMNSCVIQQKTIGSWTIVGAGAVVVNDLPSNVTAIGVPAKPIKQRQPGWQLNETEST